MSRGFIRAEKISYNTKLISVNSFSRAYINALE